MNKLILSFCICIVAVAVQAQESPVNWTFATEEVDESKHVVRFKAEIKKNWVLYGLHIDEGGPIPTGFFFDESDEISFIGDVEEKSEAQIEMDEMFEMKVTKFKDIAVFEQLIELKNESAEIVGELEYMTCDGNRCLPPTTVAFNIKIE